MSVCKEKDIAWMRKALLLAEQANEIGEVPVGAVVVFENKIIGCGYNQPIKLSNPTAHAEIIALKNAAKKMMNYRLVNCDLYVTLEPCLMCAGAIVHSRIRRLVFGACEPRSGVIQSQLSAFSMPFLNHKVEVQGGVLEEESAQLITGFFAKRRAEKNR